MTTKQNRFINRVNQLIFKIIERPYFVVFIAGLYPFLHLYNINLYTLMSWQQFVFLFTVCFGLPQLFLIFVKFVVKINIFHFFKESSLTILNLFVFSALIARFVFNSNKYQLILIAILSMIVGIVLKTYIKQIIVLQILISLTGLVTLAPKLFFGLQQNNAHFAETNTEIIDLKLNKKPNIFVIQPDGYTNKSTLVQAPYNYDNTNFYNYLKDKNFTIYDDFVSNYYSTFTSNTSLFAMKHHYYDNTDKINIKTYGANKVIVGEDNLVVNILNANGYDTNLITDNSFFFKDRVEKSFNYQNISELKIPFYKDKVFNDVDILKDLKSLLSDREKSKPGFFFIEKIIPGHITYSKNSAKSTSVKKEKENYLNRLERANVLLKDLIDQIYTFDEEALIVIVADHGGFVGLNYTLESLEREMTYNEVMSSFGAMLAIKWPSGISTEGLEFKTSVNLFRSIFYALSNNELLLQSMESNTSYIPLKTTFGVSVYQSISEDGKVEYKPIK